MRKTTPPVEGTGPDRGVSARAVLFGLMLMPVVIYWTIEMEVVRYTHPTLVHPLSHVVFVLFWMLAANAVLRRFVPRVAFSRAELITVYIMLGVVSAICSHDFAEILVTLLPYPYRFATPENEWRELIIPRLPSWLMVSDPAVYEPFYNGGSSFFTKRNLSAWAGPYLWWTAFIAALFFVLLCINAIIRKQWTEHERLSYPIIQLPLEMTAPGGRFFKNPVMWVGFSIAAFISIINLLNSIYPEVPYIPVKRQNIQDQLGLQSFGSIRIAFYPFAIGISFLIPLDLLLSTWVFYWVYKWEIWAGNAFGFNQIAGYPFGNEQGFGAYLAILSFVLWTGRSHLRRVARVILRGPRESPPEDAGEAMPYRFTAIGFLIAMGFLLFFSLRIGMSWWVFPLFFGIYFALGTMIARMRAELGFLVHDLHNIDPHSMLVYALGTRRLGPQNLTAFGLYFFFNRAYRAHPAPAQLEAFKFAERLRVHPRRVAVVLMFSTVVATVLTFTMLTAHYYVYGAASGHYGPWALGFARGIYGTLERWLTFPTETRVPSVAAMGVGFVNATLMMLIRTRFLWWPLHPLGYAMSNSWGMYNLWCPLFVAWFLKFLILKQGGLGAYRRAVPFFLGLALGDYVFGYAWSLGSVLFDRPLYQFWP